MTRTAPRTMVLAAVAVLAVAALLLMLGVPPSMLFAFGAIAGCGVLHLFMGHGPGHGAGHGAGLGAGHGSHAGGSPRGGSPVPHGAARPEGRVAPPETEMTTMADTFRDPVCGMEIEPSRAAARELHEGRTYYFCSHGCHREFLADPHRYAHAAEERAPHQHH